MKKLWLLLIALVSLSLGPPQAWAVNLSLVPSTTPIRPGDTVSRGVSGLDSERNGRPGPSPRTQCSRHSPTTLPSSLTLTR